MQIFEHQYLHYKNLLPIETEIELAEIPDYINGIAASLDVLKLRQNGNVIFTVNPSNVQFIIPVDKQFNSCKYYKFKEEFKIVNSLRARHYGLFREIGKLRKVSIPGTGSMGARHFLSADISRIFETIFTAISKKSLIKYIHFVIKAFC